MNLVRVFSVRIKIKNKVSMFCVYKLYTYWHGHMVSMKDERSVERGSSVVECRTRNQVSPGSNPSLLPFRRLGIFVLSIDALVDSAV